MIIEINDIPNNQVLKSLDVHIDFENSDNSYKKFNVDSLNRSVSSTNTQRQIITDNDSKISIEEHKVDDIDEEKLKDIEIPKEMLEESF